MRDDLKIIIISHEMEKLEEFFEEVPVLDLYFLEETEVGENLSIQQEDADELRDDVERNRRKILEEERIKDVCFTYEPTDETTLVESVVKLIVELHCDQSVVGDIIAFLPSLQVGPNILAA